MTLVDSILCTRDEDPGVHRVMPVLTRHLVNRYRFAGPTRKPSAVGREECRDALSIERHAYQGQCVLLCDTGTVICTYIHYSIK